MRSRFAAILLLAGLLLAWTHDAPAQTNSDHDRDASGHELVAPNDNRRVAGSLRDGVFELHLDARQVLWRPGMDADGTVTVAAFAEAGGAAQIPGPFIRVPQGTEVRITVRNSIPESMPIGVPPPNRRERGMSSIAGPDLIAHGLRAGTTEHDILVVPRGEVREVRYRADVPGTFLYWADTSNRSMWSRTGPDAQLTGAIVVDPAGEPPDPDERVFVITMTDSFPDPAGTPSGDNIFEPVINGLSWPHTERLHYAIEEKVRWRWLNGSGFEHPMHLHGFHFRTIARGDGSRETVYPAETTQDVVTELMEPGHTIRMEWVPTRLGNWLMHCHIRDHIIPDPPRDAAARADDMHDVTLHALHAMAGLVLGITVTDSGPDEEDRRPQHRLRLVALEKETDQPDKTIRGFRLEGDTAPGAIEPEVPGPPVVLTRGETTNISVVNRMREPTTVHWHGLELRSVYDGVAGWSRSGSRVAPLVLPESTFEVFIRPPRAGTFIYHSHMDETEQLTSGMYGPLLVMEPGQSFDPTIDRVFVFGDGIDGDYHSLVINGRREPESMTFRAGTKYRLRFIDMAPDATLDISASNGEVPLRWQALAKDGADLPQDLQREADAQFRFGAGETYDFYWTPKEAMDANILVHWTFPTFVGHMELNQALHVDEF